MGYEIEGNKLVKRSSGEERLAVHLRAHGFPGFEREHMFMSPIREWRFDFAWPARKIAVEVEGVLYRGQGRHQRGAGYAEDCRKYSTAALLGWCVIRCTPDQVKSGEAIELIAIAFGPGGTKEHVQFRTKVSRDVLAWEDLCNS